MCGSEKITEEKLPQLPYLYAIFQETIRAYSPIAIVPLRYVCEDTELGGYFVPSGSEVDNLIISHWKSALILVNNIIIFIIMFVGSHKHLRV